jgi:cytochrome b6-f complex iron-sulfur subunit
MDRRSFLQWVGAGWVASSLPVALAALAANRSDACATDTSLLADRADFQAIGTVAEFDQSGSLFKKRSPVGPLLVIRNPANAKALLAVNPTCTHKGCQVDWKANAGVFECPCHHAKFAPGGQVVQGPAKKPLASYAVKLQGDTVLVKVN